MGRRFRGHGLYGVAFIFRASHEAGDEDSLIHEMFEREEKRHTKQILALLAAQVVKEQAKYEGKTQDGGQIEIKFPNGRVVYVDAASRTYQVLEALFKNVHDKCAADSE